MEKTSGVRRLGSASLDLKTYVAAGRYEGFWETGLSPHWDVAGGIVIVREAGGLVSEINGRNSMAEHLELLQQISVYDPFGKLL